jgi:aromatic-L-amino-acid decarboxylase
MNETTGAHMSPDDFRRFGYAVIDWLADYQKNVANYPVLSTVKPGELRKALPSAPPETGEPFERVLADVDRLITPGITHWQSPNFFAFFPSNNSGPSILGELLCAGLGVQGMLWTTSPACTELEAHLMDWMADMMGLPARFKSSGSGGGVIQDSASSAVLCAILAARERSTGLNSNELGCDRRLVAYTSTQAHSSVEKAIKIAGIGRANLRFIEVDETAAMRPNLLEQAILKDREAGLIPFFVSTTIGTTSSNGFDPLPVIGKICAQNGLWMHVDGAMCGTAGICPEFRRFQEGLELADSYAFNPHKWMFTNFDCDCFFVADRNALTRALSIVPEYLRNKATESGEVIDYRDWQVPLGRRFRALKLWFVIRHYGIEGLRRHVREHVALAHEFARWVAAAPEFHLLEWPKLNLICFAHSGGTEFNRQLLETLNHTGKVFMSHTMLRGQFWIRLCVGQTQTRREHLVAVWDLIQRTAAELAAKEGAKTSKSP